MKKKVGIVVVYLFVCALAWVLFNPFTSDNLDRHSLSFYSLTNDNNTNDSVIISPDNNLDQRIIIPKRNDLKFIDIKTNSDNKTAVTNDTPFPIQISFTDNNGTVITSTEDYTVVNDWIRIKIPDQIITQAYNNDVRFSITVSSNERSVSLASSPSTELNAKYTIDNNPYNSTLVIRGVSVKSSYLYIGLWIYLFISGLVCCLLLNGFTTRSYLILSSLFGLALVVIAVYPAMFESNTVISTFRRMSAPSFAESSVNVWLPSRILNEMSYNSVSAPLFANDYSIYSVPANIGYSVLEWLYVPVLLLVRTLNMPGNLSVLNLRLLSFVFCVLINAIAISNCKRIRPVLFTISLLPVVLLSFSTLSVFGLLLSLTNIYLSILYSTLDENNITSDKNFSLFKQIVLMIVLFIVSVQNLILGLLLFILLNYIQSASEGRLKARVIWCGAVMYCLALAVNVLYIVWSKEFFNASVAVINQNISALFADPLAQIRIALNSIADTTKTALCASAGSILITSVLFTGTIAGILLSLITKTKDKAQAEEIEASSNRIKIGTSLFFIGAIISAFYLFIASLSGILSSNALIGLFTPFTCFILASVYSRSDHNDTDSRHLALPYLLMAFLLVYISSLLLA